MKREEKKEAKKAKYEKPVLTKFRKLTDVVAGSVQSGGQPDLGCTRF